MHELALLIENQAQVVGCRSFQLFVIHRRGDFDRFLQLLNGFGIICALPKDQSELVVCLPNLAAIAELFFHEQGLLGKR